MVLSRQLDRAGENREEVSKGDARRRSTQDRCPTQEGMFETSSVFTKRLYGDSGICLIITFLF